MLFFTTELDAQMLHPQNFRWTRNLIVASNFDLSLKKSIQKNTPPFRDNYQTSLYLATRMALDSENTIIKENLNCIDKNKFSICNPPLLFEIGRNGPVSLGEHTTNEYNDHVIHPKSNRIDQQTTILSALFLISIALIFTLYQIRPRSNVLVLFLSVSVIIFLGFAIFAITDKNGDPFSFTDGVSLWPTILIRLVVIILVFAFILKAIRDIEINFERLSEEYFDDKSASKQREYPTLFVRPKRRLSTETTNQWNWHSNSDTTFWVILFIAIGIGGKVIFNQSLLALAIFWIVILSSWFIYINYVSRIKSINKWVEDPISASQSDNLKELWGQYYEHGRLKHRSLRVVSMWLLFMAISSVLFFILPPVFPSPCRGDTCDIDKIVMTLSFTFVMFLIFFAIDALRLCYYWMAKLRTELILQEYENKVLETRQLKTLSKIVTLVAERTNDIDKLIYYPLIAIILLLFARSNYFDNIAFPLGICIIVTINIIMLIASGLGLRLEAQKLRTSAIRCLNLQKENDEIGNKIQNEKIDAIVNDIQSIHYGAYQPMRNQPVMRTLILILGSAALATSEYIMLTG